METSPLQKYSFFQKAFLIKPEEKIGRTTYAIRIVILWIIGGLLGFNMTSVYMWILIIFWYTIWKVVLFGWLWLLAYIMCIQAYKRVNDYGGSKFIFLLFVCLYMYLAWGIIFDYNTTDTNTSWIIAMYIIWISVYKSKDIGIVEEKAEPINITITKEINSEIIK